MELVFLIGGIILMWVLVFFCVRIPAMHYGRKWDLKEQKKREDKRYLEIGGIVHDRTYPARVTWRREK